MIIALKLKKLRKKKKLTQTKVAEYLNKSQQAYSKYESGICEPDIETLSKLCKLYSVPLNYFEIEYGQNKEFPQNIQFETDLQREIAMKLLYLNDKECEVINNIIENIRSLYNE